MIKGKFPNDKFEQLETPFYYYDMELLRKTLIAITKETENKPFHVHYALKANFNPIILKEIASFGFGADCVSGNEILRAIECGFDPSKIAFAGVGKTDKEINIGLDKGGTNNLNFNSYHVLRANYKKDKVRFNNTLEWRLSVFNAPDDSLREYRIGNDLIRYYGDFGLDAFAKGWSYSMNMEAKSQLFNSYPTNSNQLRSALLSPLYVNAGVGLKFNLDKKSEKVRGRRVRWDLALAPISLNFKYVSNDSVDVVRFGIPENKKYNLDMGTTVTSILKYDITRYITWDSRLTYFTSYDKVEAEFENSLNMALSNAFSTRIYLNVRFDDGVPPHPDLKYLQYNQTLSFGLNYKW